MMEGTHPQARIYPFTEREIEQLYSALMSNDMDLLNGLHVFFMETGKDPSWDEVNTLWGRMAQKFIRGVDVFAELEACGVNFTTVPAA